MAEISQNAPENTQKQGGTAENEPKKYKINMNPASFANLIPAKKGESRNPNGRPKGSVNRKNVEWAMLHESITGKHTDRFNRVLAKLDDEKFMDNYLRILEYFKPRLQRAENINMNTQLDRVVLVTSPDDIPTLPDNFDEDEDQAQDQEVHDITPDEVQTEGDTQE